MKRLVLPYAHDVTKFANDMGKIVEKESGFGCRIQNTTHKRYFAK